MNVYLVINGTTYVPERYKRENHLHTQGGLWEATFETFSEDVWDDVLIYEDDILVLTGYILDYHPTRGKVAVSGMDTWAKVAATWVDDDVETSSGSTVGDYIDYLMGLTDVEYAYNTDFTANGVQPNVKLGPKSVADSLEEVTKYAGIYTWVEPDGKVMFNIAESSASHSLGEYLSKDVTADDRHTRHEVKVWGLGSVFGKATGDTLGDPNVRVAGFHVPLITTNEIAQALAETALTLYNEHGDVRTFEYPGFHPAYKIPQRVLDGEDDMSITDIMSIMSKDGAKTTVTLNDRWPTIIGAYGAGGGTIITTTPDGDRVVVGARLNIARTFNFSSGSPNWEDITYHMGGQDYHKLIRETDDATENVVPLYSAFTDGVYKTADAFATPVVWEHIFDADDYETYTGMEFSGIYCMKTSGTVMYMITDAAGTGINHVFRTADGGETWSFTQIANCSPFGLHVSKANSNRVWFGGAVGDLWYSSNAGVSFTNIYTFPADDPKYIHQVLTSPADTHIYISVLSRDIAYPFDYTLHFLRSSNGGSTFADIAPVSGWAPIDHDTLVSAKDNSRVFAFCKGAYGGTTTKLYVSDDYGSSWTFKVDFSTIDPSGEYGVSGRPIRYDDDRAIVLNAYVYSKNPTNMIQFTSDLENYEDKAGDYETEVNEWWNTDVGQRASIVAVW